MNEFVMKYKELRNHYNDLESFGMVSSYIAVKGSYKDLETVHSYHMKDFLQETDKIFNEAEETNNERTKTA
ncbi:hypothetical protein [Virgibacillus sp. CBA3643]|uniref:hypothetical protein n=1 Tax=Virgibacillus sp. CBA3643 TaxID=2942278 RepID=UPI0035A37B3B